MMEDEFVLFCQNMAKMEMEEWVRQRKAFVGGIVEIDERGCCVSKGPCPGSEKQATECPQGAVTTSNLRQICD